MRLRIEVTPTDIATAKTHRRFSDPIYHAIVRQTGCPNIEVKHSTLILYWGSERQRRNPLFGQSYPLPPEATQRIEPDDQSKTAQQQTDPFGFDIELDRRGAKLLGLNAPCLRCGDYPREKASDICIVCQKYRETILNLSR